MYIKFLQSLRKSPKLVVQYLLQKVLSNSNTLTSKNVKFVLDNTDENDIFEIKPDCFKKKFKFSEIGEAESWRVGLIKELVDLRQKNLTLETDENSLTIEELTDILEDICVN